MSAFLWLGPLGTVAAAAAILLVFARSVDRAAVTSAGVDEAVRLWMVGTAAAGALAAGLDVLLVPTAGQVLDRLSWPERRGIGLALALLVVLAGLAVAAAPDWFRGAADTDHHITHFLPLQVAFAALLASPALVGAAVIAGVGVRGGSLTTCPRGRDCAPVLTDFLRLRHELGAGVAVLVVVLVAAVVVVALAQTPLRRLTGQDARYQSAHVLLFGALLSGIAALVAVPAYVVLQHAGGQLTVSLVAATGTPAGPGWLTTEAAVRSALAPALDPQRLLGTLGTLGSPLVVALGSWLLPGLRERLRPDGAAANRPVDETDGVSDVAGRQAG